MRRRVKPAKSKVEPKPSAARTSPKNAAARVHDLEERLAQSFAREQATGELLQEKTGALTAALEQQAATRDILRMISQSPTDVQPVFDAIARSSMQLCEGAFSVVLRYDGDLMHLGAHAHVTTEGADLLQRDLPRRPGRDSISGRAILEGAVVQVTDAQADPSYSSVYQRAHQARSGLAVPMLRDGRPIGAIAVGRHEVRPFTDQQATLLRTFAAQAVIAIENVRLFKELDARNRDLTEALEQQTATGEVLKVISRSAFELQPVFETLAENAVRLCGADKAFLLRFDGELLRMAVSYNASPELREFVRTNPIAPGRHTVSARAALERRTVQVADVQADPEYAYARFDVDPIRTILAVPMLKGDELLGVIVIWRNEVKPFSEKQITLLQTFADQAVIAIENVRLFTELQEKNRALTTAHAQVSEALDQQTATAEILRVISRSPTDVQPVFDAIAESAVRLCAAHYGAVFSFDGALVHLAAHHNIPATALDGARMQYPMRPTRSQVSGRAVLSGSVIQVPDVAADPEYDNSVGARVGFRSLLGVPVVHAGAPIGAIVIYRTEVGPFPEKQINLLQTFAAQAVIAIENVRLFKELQEKNRALTEAHGQVSEALDRQTATSEILRVISRSPTDVQPVFDVIAASARRLCEGAQAAMVTYDGSLIHIGALDQLDPGAAESLRRAFPMAPSRATGVGRAILSREVVELPDIVEDREHVLTAEALSGGARSMISVPMLREGVPIGAISVTRTPAGSFPSNQVELLKTFADQAVIAIENVRLFTELEARNRDLTAALDRQTATAEVLRVISQSQTEVQPVFDAIVDNAIRLFGAWTASAFQSDGELVHLIATRGGLPGSVEYLRGGSPWPIHEAGIVAGCIEDRALVHIADTESDPPVGRAIRHLARARGWRSVLAAPMLREGLPIGVIAITRAEAGSFSAAEIELLQTFADQAVIAIENARLLGELRARTGELTRSVEELTALSDVSRALGSTLDLDVVLQTIVTRASQLAGADACSVFEYDEATEAFQLRATDNLDAEVVSLARQTPVRKGEGVQGRMAVTRQPVQVADITAEDAYRGPLRDVLVRTGTRAVLAIPMLRESELIGGFTVNKRTPGEFSPAVIELLTTFATQSALAIQNARLFREIADKSRQLEVASQHKSEFLANMSHELRTPLNAIIGFSEVLSERMFGDLNDKQAEYLRDIYASGQHLLSLINDILDLSKIEAGRMELEPSEFDLPSTVDHALTLVRERAGRRGITLERDIDDGVGLIRGDERKVKQALLNLLSNAIKFTPEGGRIDVRVAVNEDRVEISVADTGVGIAPEDQEAIFEEFRQVGTADKNIEGTGLGLALSRKFVELHGGRIWVTSEVGRGATFTFTLPRLDIRTTAGASSGRD
jgi:GAF domain-containing protein